MLNYKRAAKGFTLVELLIVIAIIAILAAIVFVALNPLQRFKDARDARRWSDAAELLNAIKINQVDNGGNYISTIKNVSDGTYQIGTSSSADCNTGCSATSTSVYCINLSDLVVSGQMGIIPKDVNVGTDWKTAYYINKAANGAITVGACNPEGVSTIEVTR